MTMQDKSTNQVLIEVKDLCKSFGEHDVLKGINTTISRGDVIAIIGPPAVENLLFSALLIYLKHLQAVS